MSQALELSLVGPKNGNYLEVYKCFVLTLAPTREDAGYAQCEGSTAFIYLFLSTVLIPGAQCSAGDATSNMGLCL